MIGPRRIAAAVGGLQSAAYRHIFVWPLATLGVILKSGARLFTSLMYLFAIVYRVAYSRIDAPKVHNPRCCIGATVWGFISVAQPNTARNVC